MFQLLPNSKLSMGIKIFINGSKLNIGFSACHFIVDHFKCSKLHGHNYIVSISISGEKTDEKMGFVFDFLEAKRIIRDIISRFDHKVLIPKKSKYVNIIDLGEEIEVKVSKKRYIFPKEDVEILDIESLSAEHLAKFIAEEFIRKIEEGNIKEIVIRVEEKEGQGVEYVHRC